MTDMHWQTFEGTLFEVGRMPGSYWVRRLEACRKSAYGRYFLENNPYPGWLDDHEWCRERGRPDTGRPQGKREAIPMPRYFFNTRIGDDVIPDVEARSFAIPTMPGRSPRLFALPRRPARPSVHRDRQDGTAVRVPKASSALVD
jgi:hypothetical protein